MIVKTLFLSMYFLFINVFLVYQCIPGLLLFSVTIAFQKTDPYSVTNCFIKLFSLSLCCNSTLLIASRTQEIMNSYQRSSDDRESSINRRRNSSRGSFSTMQTSSDALLEPEKTKEKKGKNNDIKSNFNSNSNTNSK